MEKNSTKVAALSYFKHFDGIRGFCCLLILILHFRFSKYNMPAYIAYSGLHAFFIMSSYLITKTLVKDMERTNTMWECLKIYLFKRFTRTFPLYFLYLLILFILYLVFNLIFKNDFGFIAEFKQFGWMLFTFTYNYRETLQFLYEGKMTIYTIFTPHLWSMSFEEQFYVVFFFFLFFAPKKYLLHIGVSMLLLIPVIRILGYQYMIQHTDDHKLVTLILSRNSLFQIDTFFYGIILAIINIKRSRWWIYSSVFIGVLLIFLMIYTSYLTSINLNIPFYVAIREDDYYYLNYGYFYLDILANLFCFLLFGAVIAYPDKITIFTNNILVRLGVLTYNLYIFQFLFIPFGVLAAKLLNKWMPLKLAELFGLIVYLFGLYLFSEFTFRKFEKPIIEWKDRYVKKMYPTAQNVQKNNT